MHSKKAKPLIAARQLFSLFFMIFWHNCQFFRVLGAKRRSSDTSTPHISPTAATAQCSTAIETPIKPRKSIYYFVVLDIKIKVSKYKVYLLNRKIGPILCRSHPPGVEVRHPRPFSPSPQWPTRSTPTPASTRKLAYYYSDY
jgi:hypothetical protein